MLEIQKIRTETQRIVEALQRRNIDDAEHKIKEILQLDEERRSSITGLERLRSLMREGKKEEAEAAKQQTAAAKKEMKALEETVKEVESKSFDLLTSLPNAPHSSVPAGKNADDNEVIYQNDVKVAFDFPVQPHWDLAVKHDIIDWKLGVKITGAGFPVYKGKGAILQRALITFFLDRAREAGYLEIMPPLVVNADSGFGTGQLPDKEGQMYHIGEDGFYLIPTAEVPITNLYRGEIVSESDFPIKNCGYTPCFRREAGSYGKDVKGLNRLHQFDKVELVQIVHPAHSYDTLEEMTQYVEGLLRDLGFPFRRLLLCSADASFASAKTFDLEVFSAAQERWLEVSSVSNFETFQTNRLKLRYRDEENKTHLAHSLNGSALALPR
ncbi:UNVERIFIED_CONTAM: hypothetical protein GTU68_062813, partial [Idotea baltica]|nr:hypothetical protein [Idotea baltica]